MDTKRVICAYLKKYHVGAEKAVYSKELEQLFSISNSTVKRSIQALRGENEPICSGNTGYYYGEETAEVNCTTNRMEKYLGSMEKTKQNLKKARIDEPEKPPAVFVIILI